MNFVYICYSNFLIQSPENADFLEFGHHSVFLQNQFSHLISLISQSLWKEWLRPESMFEIREITIYRRLALLPISVTKCASWHGRILDTVS